MSGIDGVATEMSRIADQLKRAYEGPAWHGPAVLEILAGVTAAQAARRPIPAAHSIWEIVLHVATWNDVVRRRALGEKVQVSDAEDWPAVTATDEESWTRAKARLDAAHRALLDLLATLPESRLDQPLVPGGSNGYLQLHGVVQHDLYHAGQIAVLKKAKADAGGNRSAAATATGKTGTAGRRHALAKRAAKRAGRRTAKRGKGGRPTRKGRGGRRSGRR
jgi:uncharacterized damage-inducible protein DinB